MTDFRFLFYGCFKRYVLIFVKTLLILQLHKSVYFYYHHSNYNDLRVVRILKVGWSSSEIDEIFNHISRI